MVSTPLAKAPLVSVIVATYRCDDYLRLALASILAQTHPDFEVLVSDDGGEEATRRVVESFGDPRLRYHANPVRLGPAGNHWEAFRRARGEFVAILNHDDLWKPAFLERMLAGLADPAVVVAFCDHDVIDPRGHVLPERTAEHSRVSGRSTLAAGVHQPFYAEAVAFNLAPAQAALMRRSALDPGTFPDQAGPAYDFWLNYLLARGGGGAYYVPEMLASWRVLPTAISREITRSDWSAGGAAAWVQMATDPPFAAFHRLARRNAALSYANAALAAMRGRQPQEAKTYARRGLSWSFSHFRVLTVFVLSLLPASWQFWLLAKSARATA